MAKREEQPTKAFPMTVSGDDNVISLTGMYQNYFLDYASYVILERAVPDINDGLKPVQRRILHAMHSQHDGRYHKVANLIGQTMQYHPHGDAAIGDALVNLGQKDLLIDCQGNWGDFRTGDPAAAARYIEARLTKLALDITFNNDTTVWQLTYDGRKREPVHLSMKFPLVLALGVDGIAVGLSTKILPHNFQELCKASIAVLRGKKFELYPDFQTAGMADCQNYNAGERGGKIRVRSRIKQLDKSTLAIVEIPYGCTTDGIIESIIKANDKGQIKIKKVVDNTAANVEIQIELQPGVSPEVTTDALYAFTQCEVSISPNCCVIVDNHPIFTNVNELLRISTERTKDLLRQELQIKLDDLQEKLHFASLEKIFIEKRIYRDIEECETWEAVLETIDKGLKKYILTPSMKPKGADDARLRLLREVTEEDLIRLTEIKIKRISKYNTFKADEEIARLNDQIAETKHHLANLTDYAVAYFENLLEKHGKNRKRQTEITTFDTIKATEVVANNAKLYVDRVGGFVGMGLKKDEFVQDCSDIDDVIIFRKDGVMKVVRIDDKVFVGKDIEHVAVWKKNDDRTTYNMVYLDAASGRAMAKRFQVSGITRDKDYDLTAGSKGSKMLYLTVNPNGESEVINVMLTPGCKAKIKVFDYDFGDLDIKGRAAQGNILTKYPIKRITQKEMGKSSLGAQKIWFDDITGRINTDERGRLLGQFDTGNLILCIYRDGTYEQTDFDLLQRFEVKDLLFIGKSDPELVVNAVHYDGHKDWTMVKRFKIETNKLKEKYSFLTDHPKSKLLFVSTDENPVIEFSHKLKGQKVDSTVALGDFMDVKGWKAVGNRLSDQLVAKIKEVSGGKTAESKGKNRDSEEEKPSKPTNPVNVPLELAFDTSEEKVVEKDTSKPSIQEEAKQVSLFGDDMTVENSKPTPKPVKLKPAKPNPPKNGLKAGDTIEFD